MAGSRRPASRRRGVALVLAMACLFLIAALGVGMLQSVAVQRRRIRFERYELQAFWLAESALLRAAERLKRQPDYEGEKWAISAEEMAGAAAGEVTIRVTPEPDRAGERRVQVVARYPLGSPLSVVQRRGMIVSVDPGEDD